MKKYILLELLNFAFFASVIYFTFRGLFNSFFQQDEWYSMGPTFVNGVFAGLSQTPVLLLLSGQGRLFGSVINNAVYYYFPFRVDIIVWFALIVHTVNTFLWYKVVSGFTGKRSIAYMSALFFAAAYVSNQAVTWFAAVFTTLPSATFIFISLLLYLAYTKKKKYAYIIWAQVAAFTAYMFKESAVFIFLMLPIIYYFQNRRSFPLRKIITIFLPTIIYFVFVVSVRVHSMLSFTSASGTSFVSQTSSMWQRLISHAVFYPTLSSVQMYIPPNIIFAVARFFQVVNYGTIHGFTDTQLNVESITSDFVSFILFSAASVILTVLYIRNKRWRSLLTFGIGYVLLSFLPFIILNKGNSYLDSRYFYDGVAGGGLLLGILFYMVYETVRKYRRGAALLTGTLVFIVFSAYIMKNIQLIRRDIRKDEAVAQERKMLLKSLKNYYPVLPENAVVYMTGDSGGYYGLQELKVPLQQGPGYTIMIWYYSSDRIPKKFLSSYFLWNIKDEGYAKYKGMSFGYFWNKESLIHTIVSDKILKQQIVGLYYDSGSKKLINITDQLREELQQYF